MTSCARCFSDSGSSRTRRRSRDSSRARDGSSGGSSRRGSPEPRGRSAGRSGPIRRTRCSARSYGESMTSFHYLFRERDFTVVVDQFEPDYETNALDVEWHFEGLTPEQHDELGVTDVEEDAIVEAICVHM